MFHLLAFQGTLKSLLQHHISKASILRCSAFFFFWSNSHIQTWLLEKPWFWLFGSFFIKFVCLFVFIAVIIYPYCSILALFISWRNGGVGSGKKTEMKNRERAQEESGLCVCMWAGGKFCVSALTWKKKHGVAMPIGIWQENGKYVALTNQLEIS